MSNRTVTQLAQIYQCAKTLAEIAHAAGCTIDEVLPLLTASANRRLIEMQNCHQTTTINDTRNNG